MNIDTYTAAVTDAVLAAAELGDEQTRRTAAALATAIAAPVRLALLDALSDLATEVSDRLGDRRVTVRLDGRDTVVEVHHGPAPESETPHPTFEEVTGDISRVTLRLVEQIKSRAEEAAAQNGLSLNTWVAQAVQGALRDQMRYQASGFDRNWGSYGPPRRPGAPRSGTSEAPKDSAPGDSGPQQSGHPSEGDDAGRDDE
ncbi:toxin-antitoxin system HicB family antitoxin [Rhodococcus zopfii]|uniref:Toxin-antitoxin system HicB family antitoxin n=1 Tax=Rhodococcus zopfii TaxID=43772 RepID=A0ABU3WPB0_9NOCA|nr:toxin-antitoxin system HicB family antitoxin [Rhodococcus zopfii]